MDIGIEQLQLSEHRVGRTLPSVSPALIRQILEIGQVQPVVVRSVGERRFEILANVETWLAIMRAGFRTVRVDVISANDAEARAMVNTPTDNDPLDEARHFDSLLNRSGRPRREGDIARLARQLGLSRTYIAHSIRLLQLAPEVQQAISAGALSKGHGKVILRLSDHEQQARLALRILSGSWSVRRAEQAVAEGLGEGGALAESVTSNPWIHQLEKKLTDLVGSPVSIDQRRGHVIINYCSDNDVLDGILQRLGYRSSA